jgi:hypothetical protein
MLKNIAGLRILAAGVVCLCTGIIGVGAQQSAPATPAEVPLVLRINAREVVIDVVARDQRHDSIADLAEEEFQVFEVPRHGDRIARRILSMRVIDPRKDTSRTERNESGFHISSGAICALHATTHYELAIQAAQEPGFHQIQVKATRPNVALSFRRRYYVGLPPEQAKASDARAAKEDMALGEAACWHASTPPTLSITAHPVPLPDQKATRFIVVVKPDSLGDIGLSGNNTKVKLDFGLCTFDALGAFAQYLHSTSERELTPEELKKTQARGLVNVLQIPGEQPPAMSRLVVRDRTTGNIGIVDVSRPLSMTAGDSAKPLPRPVGSVRSFGVITPHENTLCGDVYDLSQGASALPDFWNMDPVGSIYTDKLEVWDQDIYLADGIPGATHNNLWFGIDYYGEFYVTKPGEYVFDLQSDDGAKLEIDNQTVIDEDGIHQVQAKTAHVTLAEGRHTIHVPYFQGAPTRLALVLQVKPPGGSMRVMNLADFAPPKVSAR